MNVNSAHTPISMDQVRGCIRQDDYNKFNTLLNPGAIYEMQVENQVGKKVIGIAANGEKAFFTLYYYFTECYKKIKNGDNKELEQMISFVKTFNRIKGRWNNQPEQVTKTHIANLNKEVTNKDDEDIEFEVDQMISQLLSAATDNAKELVLAKINSNDQFAKMYFYGLILGFSINDIAAFMTCPTVDIICKLSEQNMFDMNNNKVSPTKIYDILRYGKYPWIQWLGYNTYFSINNLLKNGTQKVTLINNEQVTITSLNEWAKLKNDGLISQDFKTFIVSLNNYEHRIFNLGDVKEIKINQLSEYIEGTSKKIIKTISQYNSKEEFEADLEDYNQLWNLSDELTNLTNVFLNTNQGLPTTLDKYIKKLLNIQNTVKNREKSFTKYDDNGKVINSVQMCSKDVDKLYDLFRNSNWDNIVTEQEAKDILRNAVNLDIVENFNYEKWLTDETYQEVTKQYYNLIKGTFNIFHFIDIHPQFKANFELMKCSYSLVKTPMLKMKLILAAQQAYEEDTDFWNTKMNKSLVQVIDNVITRKFFKDIQFKINTEDDWNMINQSWKLDKKHNKKLVLDNGLGFSNFKYIFENYIVPGLKSGKYEGQSKTGIKSLKENRLIKNIELKVNYNRPYYALDINVNEREISPITNIRYDEYVTGFKELAEYKIPSISNEYSIQDMFIVYNILENKNRYGSDKLTSLFKDVLSKRDTKSILYKYLKQIGEFDMKSNNLDTEELLPLVEDIKMDLAPTVTEYGKQFHNEPYVKVKSHGLITINKKVNDKYQPIQYILNEYDELVSPDNEQAINYLQYNILWSTNEDAISLSTGRLKSKDKAVVLEAIQNLISINKLLVTTNC